MPTIEPRTLKGFRDFLPEDMRIRLPVIQLFRSAFDKFGYEPLETPTLEYADILLGKYGDEAEKLIYNFTDRGGRDVAMRYDVTVPACRVLAQYQNDLPLPFKRYQIQPVWRAENTQKGRFREFYQCDIDTFGSSSLLCEAEFIAIGSEVLTKIGFEHFEARINNRKLIDGITKYSGASDAEFYTIAIAIDKLDKIGINGVIEEMRTKGIGEAVIEKIVSILEKAGSPTLMEDLSSMLKDIPVALEGIAELRELFELLVQMKVPSDHYRFDITIIRGLSYYTGPVIEFAILDGGVGSVGGGGRYDKLVSTYLGRDIPAAGGSFGIERIIEVIKDRGMSIGAASDLYLLTVETPETYTLALQTAQKLRDQGKAVVMYPDSVKMEKQLKYANRKGIRYVVFPQSEVSYLLKDMNTGEQTQQTL